MPEYTPTTTEARALYATGTPRDISVAEANAEFDRWLATHDAEVAARALEAVADTWVAEYGTYTKRTGLGPVPYLFNRAAALRSGTEGSGS